MENEHEDGAPVSPPTKTKPEPQSPPVSGPNAPSIASEKDRDDPPKDNRKGGYGGG